MKSNIYFFGLILLIFLTMFAIAIADGPAVEDNWTKAYSDHGNGAKMADDALEKKNAVAGPSDSQILVAYECTKKCEFLVKDRRRRNGLPMREECMRNGMSNALHCKKLFCNAGQSSGCTECLYIDGNQIGCAVLNQVPPGTKLILVEDSPSSATGQMKGACATLGLLFAVVPVLLGRVFN